MGFRFRKSIRLIPGVRLNISKSGLSTTLGRPGASINIGQRGARGTVGIPGSGLSYSTLLGSTQLDAGRGGRPVTQRGKGLWIAAASIGLLIAFWGLSGNRDVSEPARPPEERTIPTATKEAVVTASSLNCRDAPSSDGLRLMSIAGGARLLVRERSGEWQEVQTDRGRCWVHANYLEFLS